MPTYEYECEKTGRRFERFQAMSERPVGRCPTCGGKARRLISGGGAVLLKGGHSRFTADQSPQCGRERTCCGRDVPCDTRPCDR